MKAKMGTYRSEVLQNDWNNAEDSMNVKQDVKVGKNTDLRNNRNSEQSAWEKKIIYSESQIQAWKGKAKVRKAYNQKKEEIMKIKGKLTYFVFASVEKRSHTLYSI